MFITRLQTEWFTLAVDDGEHMLRLRRSAKKLRSVQELELAMSRLFEALEQIVPTSERPRWSFLQDMRQAPLLDNPEWEAIQLRHVDRFRFGWRRQALLVQTAIGKLQARRINGQASVLAAGAIEIFDDEIAALSYLRQSA